MSSLTESLNLIGKDIVQVLKEKNKPMTQDELFAGRKLMNYSEYGWSFALDRLVKQKLIKVSGYKRNGDLKYVIE